MPVAPSIVRTVAGLDIEADYHARGYRCIVGFDEAGRGAWAGPVSAAAVLLPVERPDLASMLRGVNDSKQVTALRRARLVDVIRATALAYGVGSASAQEIDEFGIVPSTRLAMMRALAEAEIQPDCLLLDSLRWPEMQHVHQVPLVRGDSRSLSIAAASILAKVWRDTHMRALADQYPEYGFAAHKGYGTAYHRAMLDKYAPCPIHRHSFAPVRQKRLL